jgi:hypothetical protein
MRLSMASVLMVAALGVTGCAQHSVSHQQDIQYKNLSTVDVSAHAVAADKVHGFPEGHPLHAGQPKVSTETSSNDMY